MNVLANGKPRPMPDGANVLDAIRAFDLRPEWVVVEHNGEPVERARFAQVPLHDGDRIEIVRAVAGG